MIFFSRTPIAHQAQPVGQIGVGGRDRAAVAVAAQIFARIKAKRGRMAERSGGPAVIRRSMRLAGVFDDQQIMGRRDVVNPIHVRASPVEMHRQDRSGARRNGRFDFVGIDQPIFAANIDQHGPSAGKAHAQRRGDERKRRHNHFIRPAADRWPERSTAAHRCRWRRRRNAPRRKTPQSFVRIAQPAARE